MTYYIMTSAEP